VTIWAIIQQVCGRVSGRMTQPDIIVIGDGIAGNNAAAMLAKGAHVVLIKADGFWVEKSPCA